MGCPIGPIHLQLSIKVCYSYTICHVDCRITYFLPTADQTRTYYSLTSNFPVLTLVGTLNSLPLDVSTHLSHFIWTSVGLLSLLGSLWLCRIRSNCQHHIIFFLPIWCDAFSYHTVPYFYCILLTGLTSYRGSIPELGILRPTEGLPPLTPQAQRASTASTFESSALFISLPSPCFAH